MYKKSVNLQNQLEAKLKLKDKPATTFQLDVSHQRCQIIFSDLNYRYLRIFKSIKKKNMIKKIFIVKSDR